MAKGNLFLGTARNKLGDVVLMRRDGEQVSRVRVRQIANPRTDAQTLSRLALNSATKTAQQLRGIIDHSFQGIKYGQTSVNHFTSKLTKEIRAYMEEALAAVASAAPYGTAPVLPYAASGIGAGAKALVSSGDLTALPFGYWQDKGIEVGLDLQGGNPDEITVADFEKYFGVPITDQLTFITGAPVALDYISETELFYGVRFAFTRLNFIEGLDPSEPVFIQDDTGDFTLNPDVVDESRSSVDLSAFRIGSDDDHHMYVYCLDGSNKLDITGKFDMANVCLVGVITSRFEAGAWRRSTCRLVQNPKTVSGTAAAWEAAYGYNDIQSCIELSVPSQKVTEDKYLNKEPNA